MSGVLCAFFASFAFFASAEIAVIDSGIDYTHSSLSDHIWYNEGEVVGNGVDDDANGFVDDIRGWNFANSNGSLIDFRGEDFYSPSISKFFDIQARGMFGEATKGEILWAQEKIKDSRFLKGLQGYGQYAHGTHVAGIMTRGLGDSKLIDIRIIPNMRREQAKSRIMAEVQASLVAEQDINFIIEFVFKAGMRLFATASAGIFGNIATYLDQQNVTVANASVGMGMTQARGFVTPILMLLAGGKAPEAELVNEYATFFLNENIRAQKKAFAKAPNTLFVFASGNDGLDNDLMPTSPASIGLDNTISVGATIGTEKMAPFSNFGARTVDVFAPGVGIESTVPMEKVMRMSGTSQAAPHVANIVALIREGNPELGVADVKKILMGTVDRKSFLADLSYTEGVVNSERALKATELSLGASVEVAITESHSLVGDINSSEIGSSVQIGPINQM